MLVSIRVNFLALKVQVNRKFKFPVEIYGDPAVYTTGGTYGGVLCKQFYKFHKVRVHFSQNPEGGSYGQLDGVE